MKIKRKTYSTGVYIESGFLWFPKTINGETRWLERATWKMRVYVSYTEAFFDDIEWVD